jgi:hypothetical protein
MVEPHTVNVLVTGSSPVFSAKFMTEYKVFTKWVAAEEAEQALKDYCARNGHLCSGPATEASLWCCPAAHGAPESDCDCLDLKRLKSREHEQIP